MPLSRKNLKKTLLGQPKQLAIRLDDQYIPPELNENKDITYYR